MEITVQWVRTSWTKRSRGGEAAVRLGLHERDGRLRVLPDIDPLYGLPPRQRRPPAVRLLPGQWVRRQLNHRFSSAAGVRDWSYRLDTFDVGYGPVDAGAFRSAPTVLVDQRGPVR
ncbi:hypothetical protein [Kitasatospora phosalacinea]|uniref:hypothetical protein n=1 Tax=Kitasatospora phosalacinea TaxID=2065 RepID=UPI0005268E91|nr:hypothetical protein [Kitasatospora phosalacinea]